MYNCERDSLERYKCKDCNFKSNLVIFLMQHRLHCHPRTTKTNEAALLNPILRSYPCNDCNNFETNSLLHFLRHSEAGCAKFKCDPDKTQDYNHFRTDIRVNSLDYSPGWYQCSQCSFKTQNKRGLKTHIGKKHSSCCPNWNQGSFNTQHNSLNNNIKTMPFLSQIAEWFECSHCPYKTNQMNKLRIHSRIHSFNSKRFECAHCSFKTRYKNSLNKHIHGMHSSLSSTVWFQCPHCFFKTKYKKNLETHIGIMHTPAHNPENSQCSHCSFKTKDETNLKKHIRRRHPSVHIPSGSFQCLHCSYKTKHKGNFWKHMRRFHSLDYDPLCFQCPYCQLTTKSQTALTKHLQRDHSELTSKVDDRNLN